MVSVTPRWLTSWNLIWCQTIHLNTRHCSFNALPVCDINLSLCRLLPPFQEAICQFDALCITLQGGIAWEIIITKDNGMANTTPRVVLNNNISKSSSSQSNLCQSLHFIASHHNYFWGIGILVFSFSVRWIIEGDTLFVWSVSKSLSQNTQQWAQEQILFQSKAKVTAKGAMRGCGNKIISSFVILDLVLL